MLMKDRTENASVYPYEGEKEILLLFFFSVG